MLLQVLLAVEEEGPEANDVVAGWTGLVVLLALALAVGFLGWSLVKQLKKADRAAEAGVYDDPADGGDVTDRGESSTDR